VRQGGHAVPEETIRRRYRSGLRNFFELYQPLATTWRVYDNRERGGAELVAMGSGRAVTTLINSQLWDRIYEQWRYSKTASEDD
jgi:predicted ABC-type ATPase